MTLTVATGMWGPKRAEYAKTFIAGFLKHWPAGTKLVIYSDAAVWEELAPGVVASDRVKLTYRRLLDIPGYVEFRDRHVGVPAHNGREQLPQHRWKPRFQQNGYNFKFDAVKFAGQGFIPQAAAKGLKTGDILVWLDADVVSHTDVPAGFVEGLLGKTDGAYLGRGRKHSEIGFWAVRINNLTRPMLAKFAELYRTDQVFELGEWHSAYVWDACRVLAEAQGLKIRNLTPDGHDHVWFQSPLAEVMDHLKGESRKAIGRSPERRR